MRVAWPAQVGVGAQGSHCAPVGAAAGPCYDKARFWVHLEVGLGGKRWRQGQICVQVYRLSWGRKWRPSVGCLLSEML